MITDMGAEGVEETLQTAVDPLIRNTVFKENNNLLLSGKDYLESFFVGALSVGALHAKSTAIGLSTDVKTMKMDVKLPDGTYVGADVINRYFSGNATESDVNQIKQLGSSINEENMNSVLKRMDDIANVKMGKQTYGEMNKAMKGMTASQKIDHLAQVMSSPEFKAHTEELIKTAQEQKAKAEDINKNKTADVSDVKQNAENINTYNSNSDNSIDVIDKADNADSKSQEFNNDNKVLTEDDKNSNEHNSDFNKVNQNSAVNENKGIDTDNVLSENNQADNNTNVSNVSNINNDSTSNVNSDGSYGNEADNSSQGIASGDKMGYKGGEGKNYNLLNWNKIISKKGETRIEHINKHSVPNKKRDSHGVFNGSPEDIINKAWVNKDQVEPINDGIGGMIYNIPYKNAGYESGQNNTGTQMDYVTVIIVDGTNDIITAFPSYGDYKKEKNNE